MNYPFKKKAMRQHVSYDRKLKNLSKTPNFCKRLSLSLLNAGQALHQNNCTYISTIHRSVLQMKLWQIISPLNRGHVLFSAVLIHSGIKLYFHMCVGRKRPVSFKCSLCELPAVVYKTDLLKSFRLFVITLNPHGKKKFILNQTVAFSIILSPFVPWFTLYRKWHQ